MAAQESSKPIHSLVLDTGPLILNDPPASTLVAQAECLYTPPSVLDEIRDKAARSRVETTLLPFVTLRSPNKESVRFVHEFARRTGDLQVLSRTDVEVLALGYELECERNGGDWRLRKTPGQDRINGAAPEHAPGAKPAEHQVAADAGLGEAQATLGVEHESALQDGMLNLGLDNYCRSQEPEAASTEDGGVEPGATAGPRADDETTEAAPKPPAASAHSAAEAPDDTSSNNDGADSDSDSGGWITPSNLKKQQAKDAATSTGNAARHPPQTRLQAVVLTSDYAMQNVALRINLNLVAPSLKRITHLRTWVLRCHACFSTTRDMAKLFCPSCGQPTLLRTSCSTDAHGKLTLHLKQNFQYNKRGNVYSVPKPVCGSASGRNLAGGGKNAWGHALILAADQKEYTRADDQRRRARTRDLMDRDYLPGIMGRDRQEQGERIRVGAGRNVNSRRKR
ncbi:hypothetical protein CDD82_3858 [Ophiocordyceps australis]|uniref:20S-pre-rRNA D-site endonuclease NOB1 n=1 Tax=Ophiocordyceps australis TaxID=1399860 RepID=A0A2C5Z4L6_9HYPO|nr:hypothetical protein CDD82_3858 [Ophiocordyceps australis]